ncbi:hypothetical protein NECAME_11867 [Necator americanus]|uniref:Uncharacterized protein n=1 Tax=Necator americanus TaxID=51031 RepID=W2T4P9_NECAM|nr:hypothetical protein NECAME_11867 [Necator americanus]ETN76201.1 hypothetical protein NECAME_11867 [Necator americanus]
MSGITTEDNGRSPNHSPSSFRQAVCALAIRSTMTTSITGSSVEKSVMKAPETPSSMEKSKIYSPKMTSSVEKSKMKTPESLLEKSKMNAIKTPSQLSAQSAGTSVNENESKNKTKHDDISEPYENLG